MEVSQFTYFQQVGGIECDPVSTELTYGLERLAMYVQGVESIYDLDFNGAAGPADDLWRRVHAQRARILGVQFRERRHRVAVRAISPTPKRNAARAGGGLALPAYDQCLKASHLFNLLDARGAISVTERAAYILRVRASPKAAAKPGSPGFMSQYAALGRRPCRRAAAGMLSEEIPARMQRRAIEDLTRLLRDKLAAAELARGRIRGYVTPRRLVVIADGIPPTQPDRTEERRGPRVGAPQAAIDGFLRSAGLASIDKCEIRDTGRGEFYFAIIRRPGRPSAEVLAELVQAAIAGCPGRNRCAGRAPRCAGSGH